MAGIKWNSLEYLQMEALPDQQVILVMLWEMRSLLSKAHLRIAIFKACKQDAGFHSAFSIL